jgi:hypothetical protein
MLTAPPFAQIRPRLRRSSVVGRRMRVDPIVPVGASPPDPTNAQRIPWGEQNRPRERRPATLKMMVLSVSGQSMGRVVQYHMRPFLFRTRRCSVSLVVVTVQLNGSKQSRRRCRVCFRWWVPLRPGEKMYRVPIAWCSVVFGNTVWHMAAVASRGAAITLVGKTRIGFGHCHWSDSHFDGPARHLRLQLQVRNVSVVVKVVVGQSVQVTLYRLPKTFSDHMTCSKCKVRILVVQRTRTTDDQTLVALDWQRILSDLQHLLDSCCTMCLDCVYRMRQ